MRAVLLRNSLARGLKQKVQKSDCLGQSFPAVILFDLEAGHGAWVVVFKLLLFYWQGDYARDAVGGRRNSANPLLDPV